MTQLVGVAYCEGNPSVIGYAAVVGERVRDRDGIVYVKSTVADTGWVLATDVFVAEVAGAGVADGDKGDITVSAAGTVWTIDPGAVTLAKQANLAADSLIGRGNGGGAGVPQAITLGTNLSMAGTVLNATGGGGSIGVVVTLDFGAGDDMATTVVTGQTWVTAASILAATAGGATADHDAEDAILEELKLSIADLVVGVGFTVFGYAPYGTWGQYTINCAGSP